MPRTSQFPNATLAVDISPEYLGVGYVIGPRIAGTMVAGGVLAWLGLLPLLSILDITEPFPPIHPNFANNPATGRPFLLSEMDPNQTWSAYPVSEPAACSPQDCYARAHDSVDRRVGQGSLRDFSAAAAAGTGTRTDVTYPWLSSSAGPCCSQSFSQ